MKGKQKTKLNHGLYGPMEGIKKLANTDESASNFFTRSIKNFQITVSHCVTDSSHLTYSTGYRTYIEFCCRANIDNKLERLPAYAITEGISHGEYKLRVIGAFMSYCAHEKELHPNTVVSYTNGVRDAFRREHLNILVFNEHQLKDMKRALHIDWRATHEEVAHTKTLPFTLDMMTTFKQMTSFSNVEEWAMLIGAELQFLQLMRVSEIIPTPSLSDHHMRGSDVDFELRLDNGNVIFIHPSQARYYQEKHLQKVHITIRSAKNDEDGEGYKYTHSKQINLSKTITICIASDMYRYATKASPNDSDPFLSFQLSNGHRRWLNYERYNDKIKAVARACGLEDHHYHTHSLRVGGATLLAAAGHPNHYIQRMGRWKSEAYLQYMHFAISSMNKSQMSLLDSTIFTKKHLIETNSAAKAL